MKDSDSIKVGDWKYVELHKALYYIYGKAPECVFCNKDSKRFEWANVSGFYTIEIEDYLPMCLSCHRAFDWTNEAKVKQSERLKGNKYAKRRAVEATDVNGVVVKFNSITEAASSLDILVSSIANCLAGKTKKSGGLLWQYQIQN